MRRLGSVLVALALGACVPEIPHHVEERRVEEVATIEVSNLPPQSRVEIADASGRRVLAAGVSGSAKLVFPYAVREHVDNGEVGARKVTPSPVTLFVSAPGFVPRKIAVQVPAVRSVDAALEAPALSSVGGGHDPAMDRLLFASLEGRCDDAKALAEQARPSAEASGRIEATLAACAKRAERRRGDDTSHDWDPASLDLPPELVAHPETVVDSIAIVAKKENDTATERGVAAIHTLVLRGELDEAARIAALVAEPLPPKRAALVLTLPASLLAEQELRFAYAALHRGNTRGAMLAARGALAMAPWVAAAGYTRVRAARAEALAAKARTYTKSPLVARGYWLAARATKGDLEGLAEGLAATDEAAKAAVRTRLAVLSNDGAVGAALVTELTRGVPRHVVIEPDAKSPDAVLLVAVSGVEKKVVTRVDHRTKSVVAYHVTRPNPAYEEARQAVADAAEEEVSATENYNRLHEAAVDMANRAKGGGIAGSIAAAAAVSEEGTGQTLLIAARQKLKNARAKFASTPLTIREDVKKDAAYPVVHFEADATQTVKLRLDGFGERLEDAKTATAHLAEDQVLPAPKLQIEGTASPQDKIVQMKPELSPILVELAKKAAEQITSSEESQAWDAVLAARRSGSLEAEAAASAMYVQIAPEGSARALDVIFHLSEVLP